MSDALTDGLPAEVNAAVDTLRDDYDLQGRNDKGGNSYVLFGRSRVLDAPVAIKFHFSDGGEDRHDEPRRLHAIQSPNVLRVLHGKVFSKELACFVTPLCTGGDLDDTIAAGVTATEALDLALQICQGVGAIHAAGLVHRDLKPANIMVEGGVPLIADFGSVRALPEGSDSVPGSQHAALYRPPEIGRGEGYSRQGDVYQVGIVLFQLLGGELPYDPLRYIPPKDWKAFSALSDPCDQSQFVDRILTVRAEKGTLLKFETLPPWVTTRVRRVIRRLTTPRRSKRVASIAEAAALINGVYAEMKPWLRTPDGAECIEADRRVAIVRDPSSEKYEAFIIQSESRRRMRGRPLTSLEDHVKALG